jgi:ppGpp synthetase/RelA/SpoT-type nucleotidyltranferase
MENKPTEKMDEEFTQKTYAEFAVKFTCARNIAGALLANCAQARNRSSGYNVYYQIYGRTKKYSSAMKKCEAKGVAKT